MQLHSTSGRTGAVVVSTLMEAWQIVSGGLIKDGTVDDVSILFLSLTLIIKV